MGKMGEWRLGRIDKIGKVEERDKKRKPEHITANISRILLASFKMVQEENIRDEIVEKGRNYLKWQLRVVPLSYFLPFFHFSRWFLRLRPPSCSSKIHSFLFAVLLSMGDTLRKLCLRSEIRISPNRLECKVSQFLWKRIKTLELLTDFVQIYICCSLMCNLRFMKACFLKFGFLRLSLNGWWIPSFQHIEWNTILKLES